MNALKIVLGFVPFLVFSLLATSAGPGVAAVAGFAVAVVVIAVTAKGGIKIIPTLQAGMLLVMAVVGFVADDAARADISKYGPPIASLIMGVYMILTAARWPFSAQVARENVPRQFWHDPRFLAVNRRISSAWGVAVLLLGLCALIGAAIDTHGWHLIVRLAIIWVLPILAFRQAATYTSREAGAAAARAARLAASTPDEKNIPTHQHEKLA